MGCPTPTAALQLIVVVALMAAWPMGVLARPEVDILMDVKSSLDPNGNVLLSWKTGEQPCSGSFEGVLCDSVGRVTVISLQGRTLSGFIPEALSELSALSGLFLQFNKLQGTIPDSLSSLTNLTDLYLNVNQLSGGIPPQLGQITGLQVCELCCNNLEGQIPVELGNLTHLETLALESNNLNGTIPDSFGKLTMLTRLDVSYNILTGSIPSSIANLSKLIFLDVCNNSLSGAVPAGLFRLQQGFKYSNNSGLCGPGSGISVCSTEAPSSLPSTSAPTKSSRTLKLSALMSVATAIVLAIGGSAFFILVFICLRRRNARLRLASASSPDLKFAKKSGTKSEKADSITDSACPLQGSFHGSTPDFSILGRSRVMSDRSTSTVASKGLPSPAEWSSWIHLDELETATNYFSEKNLLRKNCHSAVYKGVLRDGSVVAVKAIYNTRFSFEEQDFQMAIEALMQVKHENLVSFLGFCCSKGGSECYLVYAFVPNGSLEHHLHGQSELFMNWSMRVNLIRGIAKGLAYMHEGLPTRPLTMVHQNLWAGNVLLDKQGNALLSDYGLSDIVAEEVMYATHKTLASLGYLAPEYAYTGHVTEDFDVYAFGALVLELLTGHRPVFFIKKTRTLVSTANWVRPLLELGKVREFMDPKLESNFSLAGAAGLAHIAIHCMSDDPGARPNMEDVVRRLYASEGWADMAIDSFLITATPGHMFATHPPSFAHTDTLYQWR